MNFKQVNTFKYFCETIHYELETTAKKNITKINTGNCLIENFEYRNRITP